MREIVCMYVRESACESACVCVRKREREKI